MFWVLLLAHFLADYPFQPTWMVRNKTEVGVLSLHAGIHFGIMLALTWPGLSLIWPYLLLLTCIHFLTDAGKNWFTVNRPSWSTGSYLIDQVLHILAIGLVVAWMGPINNAVHLPIHKTLIVYALGFLLVTYVWLISEHVLWRSDADLRNPDLIRQDWSRLFIRGGLLAVVLIGWHTVSSGSFSLILPLPYTSGKGMRGLWIDILVVLAIAGLVIVVNG